MTLDHLQCVVKSLSNDYVITVRWEESYLDVIYRKFVRVSRHRLGAKLHHVATSAVSKIIYVTYHDLLLYACCVTLCNCHLQLLNKFHLSPSPPKFQTVMCAAHDQFRLAPQCLTFL